MRIIKNAGLVHGELTTYWHETRCGYARPGWEIIAHDDDTVSLYRRGKWVMSGADLGALVMHTMTVDPAGTPLC